MIEKVVEEKVKKWLITKKAYFKKNKGSIYLSNGVPDFDACLDGRYVGIETKTGNGHKVSVLQLFEGFKITSAGGLYVIAYEDFEEIENLPIVKFEFSLEARSAKNLVEFSDEDFKKLEKLYEEINQRKESIKFILY